MTMHWWLNIIHRFQIPMEFSQCVCIDINCLVWGCLFSYNVIIIMTSSLVAVTIMTCWTLVLWMPGAVRVLEKCRRMHITTFPIFASFIYSTKIESHTLQSVFGVKLHETGWAHMHKFSLILNDNDCRLDNSVCTHCIGRAYMCVCVCIKLIIMFTHT